MNKIKTLPKKNFPQSILEIPQIPEQIYIKGEIPDWKNNKFLTIVGSRKYTNYGKDVCEKIISELKGYNITIISGLAIGIDSIAHRAALNTGLKTIAIPGSGLEPSVIYPSINRQLAKKIIDSGGCLLSEFEPNFRATVWSFPKRNRIMAGLADIILIIEASEKSGTLITARMGIDYNKDICVVPGSIFSRNSIGSNKLLHQGATPITCGKDLLNLLNLSKKNKSEQKYLNLQDFSDEEQKILNLLEKPMSRDELIQKLEISTTKLNYLISIMEIKGLIRESMGEIKILF